MTRKENVQNIAQRKEQIIRAAISAFARTGLKDTSMDDIVRESGMSKGAIYWYFKSKDELISELLNTFFDPKEIKRVEEMLATVLHTNESINLSDTQSKKWTKCSGSGPSSKNYS